MATYSPKDVKLTFAGIQNVKGWATITIDQTSDNYSQNTSADGVQGYTQSADHSGTMEISVQQTNTEFHLAMAALMQVIRNNEGDDITVSANLIERKGGNTSIITGIRLNRMASQSFANEMEDRTYSFLIEDLQYVPTPEGLSTQAREVANAKSFADTIKLDAGLI